VNDRISETLDHDKLTLVLLAAMLGQSIKKPESDAYLLFVHGNLGMATPVGAREKSYGQNS